MGGMTATDELRKMLDERGVEWAEYGGGYTEFWVRTVVDGEQYYIDTKHYTVQPNVMGSLILTGLTPEQVITATLGQCTCRNVSGLNPVDVFTCSECGRSFIVNEFKVDVDGVLDDDSPFEFEPRHCPNCGAKVVAE